MKKHLNISCFLHVHFEEPGLITEWIQKKGHQLDYTRLYKNEPLPDPDNVDLLIIMGGPMNVSDFHLHPWMKEELDWVGEFIESGKAILGICLGAQIIATALGSDVYPGKEKEIGWFGIRFLPGLGDFKICKNLPSSRKVFHWHGDTFDIPEGAIRIAESNLFPNQGFIYEKRVIALQFHLEVGPENVDKLVENCREELVHGTHIQSESELRNPARFIEKNRLLLFNILDYLGS